MKDNLKAVALKYDPALDSSPRVSASGRGRIAERIIEIARASGIPVHEDSDLVEILSGLDIGSEIPEDTFTVVAEILTTVIMMRSDAGIGENGKKA